MSLVPYAKLLTLAKDALDKIMAPARVKSMRAKAKLKIAELEEQILAVQQKVTEACQQKEIDFDRIPALIDEVALLERRKEQLDTIVDELFPESK